jgi:aminoglycoside phosphotransferase (APT) family kinase protein
VITSFTFVKKREGLSDERFFARWTEHTRDFDLVDHPYVTRNRLLMIAGDTPFVGIAENQWPDMESLARTGKFYEQTEKGRAHWADLLEFMDIENSPTVIATREAEVGPDGITHLIPSERQEASVAAIDLPPTLRSWIEDASGLSVTSAKPHFAGASRNAWNVEVERGSLRRELFLLRDKSGAGGSFRDAAVLRALASTPVPVPEVIGHDESLGAILLERIPGRSDFPAVDHEAEREPTAQHLMELTGALLRLDPATLKLAHLSLPETAESCALAQLQPLERTAVALGNAADPLFAYAQGWLQRNIPSKVERISLVHSDMGPGNFLSMGGRVTGIVDWEVAHFGDPMEDLAAVAVRDMATPMGHLPTRLREYEESSGIEVDLQRVGYYRALVLTRNSMLIGMGLAHPPPGFDVVEMTMYQTLLMRAAALVICDNLGVERPRIEAPEPAHPAGSRRRGLIAGLRRDLDETIAPALGEGLASRRAVGMGRALAAIDHDDQVGPALDRSELDDLATLLGHRPTDLAAAEAELRAQIDALDRPDRATDRRLAGYFARRMLRLAERRRPLMGELWDRLPQPLEES